MRAVVWFVPLLAACASAPEDAGSSSRAAPPVHGEARATAPLAAAETVSVGELIALALERGPELDALRAGSRAAAARRTQAGLWPNPRITAMARDVPRDSWSIRDGGEWLMVMQPIAVGGRIAAARRAAEAEEEAVRCDVAAAARRVAAEVRRAAAELTAAETVLSLARETAAEAEGLAASFRAAAAQGARGETEALESEAEAARFAVVVERRERECAAALAELRALLGDAAPALRGVTWDAPLPGPETVEPLADHPSALAAAARVRAAELRIGEARAAKVPDLEVTLAVGRIGEPDEGMAEAGVGITVPLFDSGETRVRERRAELSAAQAEERRVLASLASRRLAARAAVAAGVVDFAGWRDRIVPAAERIAEQTEAARHGGSRTPQDAVLARRSLADARAEAAEALRGLRIAEADLFEAGRDVPEEALR